MKGKNIWVETCTHRSRKIISRYVVIQLQRSACACCWWCRLFTWVACARSRWMSLSIYKDKGVDQAWSCYVQRDEKLVRASGGGGKRNLRPVGLKELQRHRQIVWLGKHLNHSQELSFSVCNVAHWQNALEFGFKSVFIQLTSTGIWNGLLRLFLRSRMIIITVNIDCEQSLIYLLMTRLKRKEKRKLDPTENKTHTFSLPTHEILLFCSRYLSKIGFGHTLSVSFKERIPIYKLGSRYKKKYFWIMWQATKQPHRSQSKPPRPRPAN